MVCGMGKHPAPPQPVFDWARTRPGHYVTTVDGITYVIARARYGRRWDLTGKDTTGATVCSTVGDTCASLRIHARRNHRSILERSSARNPKEATPMPKPDTGVLISPAILAALKLPRASFQLTDEGNGFFARYQVQPPDAKTWVRLVAFKPTAAEAVAHVDTQVRAETSVGGQLYAEMTERLA